MSRKGWDEEHNRLGGCSYSPKGGGWTMRITFHVRKYSVTIIIRETHTKDRRDKNNRHSAK